MGLLQWLGLQRKTISTSDLARLLDTPVKPGQVVNWQTALQVSTVLGCARVYANGLAQVPFKLRQKRATQGSDPAVTHPLYDVTANAWADRLTSFEARQQVGLHLSLTGNCYVFKVLGFDRKKVKELLPIDPRRVSVREGSGSGSIEYRVQVGGEIKEVDPDLIWHIRFLPWDGVSGLNAVRLLREAIGLSMSAEEHGAKFFGNGARLSGVLTTDASLTQDQAKVLRESWQSEYGGSSNAFRTAVLWAGLKYQPMGKGAEESQYVETRSQQIEEVCRGFGVLPIMVGHSDKTATYASAEAMFQAHLTHTLMPAYSAVETSADLHLLSKDERASGLYFHLEPKGLLRGSIKDRALFYTAMLDRAVFNPNEVRELEDMNPYEGGDVYRAQANTPPHDQKPGDANA